MSIETSENKTENQEKKAQENRREEMSGDECERKDQDPPLEIGEHYLVKRGEDSWRTFCCIANQRKSRVIKTFYLVI